MNETLALTVIVLGLLISLVANFWAWSWILGVRRRTRLRRLAQPEEALPTGPVNEPVAESTPSEERRQSH